MGRVRPFELTVSGKAVIPHAAERGLINVSVSSQGGNKAAVSDEVITTAKHIESMLRDLSPTDTSAEAKAVAPLAHWNKTSLSSTSFVPYDYDKKQALPREYKASVSFDIRFKEFKALGAFGTKISSLPHVEVQNIHWILTDTTEKSYRSRLRREATTEALNKAKDYCDVLGCTSLRPVELTEGDNSALASYRGMDISHVAAQQYSSMAPMQQAPGLAGERDHKVEDLEFRPQEVRMSMTVTIKFQADPINNSQSPVHTKGAKVEDEDMEVV